jgi:MFS-type transporter involved in bile tolerance (Atg22 family)
MDQVPFQDDSVNQHSDQLQERRKEAIGRKWCNWTRLATNDATGFLFNRCGAGPVIISNVFLSTSLILLAEREIDCEEDDVPCGKVYGLKPSSLISLIATLSGILSCFFLPFMGAIVDYTKHRWTLGIVSCSVLVLVQAIQIGTVQKTWFVMSILQAINGFVYQVVTLAVYAYLPEIASEITEKKYNWYSSLYYMTMFGHQALYIVIIVALDMVFDLDDVQVGMVSQGLDTLVTGSYWTMSWYYFTKRDAMNKLPEGKSLFTAGFSQVYNTAIGIQKHYPKTVGFFFLGVVFSQAAVNSFTTVSITYINEVLQFDSTQTGLIFLVVLVSTLPGSAFANVMTNRINVKKNIILCLVVFMAVNFAAFFSLKDETHDIRAYGFGVVWGFMLGWYYPLEKNMYTFIVPRGQEAELAGFFLYCGQILTWLPPLIFTIMNEADINLSWAGITLNGYMLVAIILWILMKPWDQCIEDAKMNMIRDIGSEVEVR